MADPDQQTAALWAVLQNAAEALHDTPDARITLAVSAMVGQTLIAITDYGPGIATANSDDLFRPVFTTKEPDTGLGLAIARSLIEGAGGTLTLRDGPVTTFLVEMPS